MQHIFIINPKAGKRNTVSRFLTMADTLRRQGLTVTTYLTQRSGHAEELCREIAQRGEEVRFYACGGDGTLHEVANGIAGFPNAAMTAIPGGSGNDFLRNFGPDAARFSQPETFFDAPAMALDLIECNDQVCLTIACCGLDARIADSVEEFRTVPLLQGKGRYLAAIAKNFLLRPIVSQWTVTVDGETTEGAFTLAAVCNGRYYGGGFTPVPEARMDDGILHAVVIRGINRPTFARLFGDYAAGRYHKLPPKLVQVKNAREVRIQATEDITVCLDGECFSARNVTLRLSPRKLLFFAPPGCNPNATAACAPERSFTFSS